jgi:hypothetical protein
MFPGYTSQSLGEPWALRKNPFGVPDCFVFTYRFPILLHNIPCETFFRTPDPSLNRRGKAFSLSAAETEFGTPGDSCNYPYVERY